MKDPSFKAWGRQRALSFDRLRGALILVLLSKQGAQQAKAPISVRQCHQLESPASVPSQSHFPVTSIPGHGYLMLCPEELLPK